MTNLPTRRIWLGMLWRCNNPKSGSYRNYGAKGITVCKRWEVFENFLADMGPRPKGHSIERNDGKKNYEPENCRWATRWEQNNNRSNNRIVEYRGTTMPLGHAYKLAECTIKYDVVIGRLRSGWSVERALTEPKFNSDQIKQAIRLSNAKRIAKTHCIRGHELSGDNLIFIKDGRRSCRQCKSMHNRRLYEIKKASETECDHRSKEVAEA